MSFHVPKKKFLMGGAKKLRPQDVFNVQQYTGTGAERLITTGLDMSGKGGLAWFKNKNNGGPHALFDTVRGPGNYQRFNNAMNPQTDTSMLREFRNNGFLLGPDQGYQAVNYTNQVYMVWSFLRARKFFDIVTWTGNGAITRKIAHGLSVKPGMMLIRRTDVATDTVMYHRGIGAQRRGLFNSEGAVPSGSNTAIFGGVEPTEVEFTVGSDNSVNGNGGQYEAYLFAHNPDLIDCGFYTGGKPDGSLITAGTGWRPQFLYTRVLDYGTRPAIFDAVRGTTTANGKALTPTDENAEYQLNGLEFVSTGYTISTSAFAFNYGGGTICYMAIRSPT